MKIMHIIDSGGLYGAENMILDLMEEQNKRKDMCVLCSIGSKGIDEKPVEIEAKKRGIEVKKIRMRNGPNIIGALRILNYALIGGFEIVHSHGYKSDIFLGWMPKRFRKVPMVTTLHGWTDTMGNKKLRWYRYVQIRCLKNIDQVVVVNSALAENKELSTIRRKMNVVKNGISPLIFSIKNIRLDKTFMDFCQGKYIIGTIGRLSREKGYSFLLKAMVSLCRLYKDMSLVILGEGPERDKLQRYIDENNLSDRVIMPGYRSNAYDYLKLFDVFVLSSLSEGLPITLLEAMQARVPVVATRVGGVPEVINDRTNGILINPMDEEGLVDAISLIYHEREFARSIACSAGNTVLQEYTVSRMADEYSSVYEKATMSDIR